MLFNQPVHLLVGMYRENWAELLHMRIISGINSNLTVKSMTVIFEL